MGVALLRTNPTAGAAAYTILCISKGHDHAVIFVFVESRVIFGALDQFKNLAWANLVAATTTDTVRSI
jgi:hypothetical protein